MEYAVATASIAAVFFLIHSLKCVKHQDSADYSDSTCTIMCYSTFDIFTDEYVCSECGHSEYVSVRYRYTPSQCPNCGAKVVE
jgi:DNA-directed RNA polymerase subunit RPC12/RpoP